MSDLQGKVALVTGAGRGIGKAAAHLLAQRGMRVGLNDVDPALAAAAESEFRAEGLDALAVPGSVSRKADAAAIVEQVEARLGPIWLLVNNAGVFSSGPTSELSEEAWDTTFNVDAKGVFLCSQAAIQKMIP